MCLASFFRLLLLFLSGVIFSSFLPYIHAQNVHNSIDKDTLRIGDILEYRLVIQKGNNTTEVLWPDSTFFSPSFELYDKKQYRLSNKVDSIVYYLQFFDNQDGTIARFPITFISPTDTTNRYAPAVAYYFVSVSENDSTLKAIKENFIFEQDYSWLWWLLLIIIILVAIGIYIWKYIQKRKSKPIIITDTKPIPDFIDPFEELRKILIILKNDNSILFTDNFKPYYIQLGDSIRAYIERMHNISALEMTTRELLIALRQGHVDSELIDSCNKVLSMADMIKFARYQPSLQVVEQSWKQAWQFYRKAKEIDQERFKILHSDYQQQYTDTEKLITDDKVG